MKQKNKVLMEVIEENKDLFSSKTKIKDQFDLEYDMGKKKKLRKKHKKKKKKLNFNKIWKQKLALN